MGLFSSYRQFTHSLVATFLFSVAIALIYTPVAKYFFVGYLSHLLIDLLNHKGIQLFFPSSKTMCLSLFYADDIENTILMYAGLICTIVMSFLLISKGHKLF